SMLLDVRPYGAQNSTESGLSNAHAVQCARKGVARVSDEQIYRQESLDYHAGHIQEGELLLMLPRWMRWVLYLVIAVALSGVAFLAVGSVPQYVPGPAIIQESLPESADTTPVLAILVPGWHRSDVALQQPV